MELLLSALVLVLCKRVPAELNLKRIDKLHEKVRLIKAPLGAVADERPKAAVLRLTIPVDENGLEIDQDNKAIAVNGFIKKLACTVIVLNQSASRAVREDFVCGMAKPLPDVFKDDSVGGTIMSYAERLHLQEESRFIEATCSEFEMPCFDVPTSAQSFE
jgi:hypothetical protein